MSEATTDTITGLVNNLNLKLEENRKQSIRLKGMLDQIHKEVDENKEEKITIEKEIDRLHFIITQKNLS